MNRNPLRNWLKCMPFPRISDQRIINGIRPRAFLALTQAIHHVSGLGTKFWIPIIFKLFSSCKNLSRYHFTQKTTDTAYNQRGSGQEREQNAVYSSSSVSPHTLSIPPYGDPRYPRVSYNTVWKPPLWRLPDSIIAHILVSLYHVLYSRYRVSKNEQFGEVPALIDFAFLGMAYTHWVLTMCQTVF